MRAIFVARRRETVGLADRLALWLDAIADVIASAAAVHWDILRQDLRYTARTLARSPGFALTAILVTALGIGANTAAFSVADFVLVRPLPYRDADRLVKVWEQPSSGRNEVPPPLYQSWKAANRSFETIGAYHGTAVNLIGRGDPARLEGSAVTASLLPILGVQPVMGRLFDATEEQQNARSVVLSYETWQTQFAGDAAIVGQAILLDGAPRVVIGVMPKDFHYPNRTTALWTLMGATEQGDDDWGNSWWEVLARLRPGVSLEQARADLMRITVPLQALHPEEMEGIGAAVIRLRDEFSSQSRLLLLALCGAAGCVLLIACANLANLLLARALTRRKELLVRSALGAGRERLLRQSITESLVLATLGGALGIVVAVISVPLLTRLVPTSLPIAQAPSVDPRIVLFAALLTAVTGLAFGVFPAWRASRQTDFGALRGGQRVGGRRQRARSALVVAEVMASVILLISAGLLLRALLRLQGTDPGFKAERVLTMRTALSGPTYDTVARRATFYSGVLTQVRALPGVTSAAYVTALPFAMGGGIWPVVPDGQVVSRAKAAGASSRFVTPGYFATLDIPIRRGRDIAESDDANQPWVAVVSESFAKRYWPNEDPLGKRFTFLNDERTVVGVVGDVRVRGPEQQSEPQVYLSYKQIADGQSPPFNPKDLVIRASLPASSLVPAVRQAVLQVDPHQPISNIKPMTEVVADATGARAVQVRVLVAFAAIAFLLAAVGIHGLLSFAVASRQHEIGVRMALGAQRGEIVRMVMRQGMVLAAAGVLPGLFLAYLGGRAMQGLLAGVRPDDALTFGVAGALCVAMTLLGSLLPTLRAVRVDPVIALRADA
jgi:predicted permease